MNVANMDTLIGCGWMNYVPNAKPCKFIDMGLPPKKVYFVFVPYSK